MTVGLNGYWGEQPDDLSAAESSSPRFQKTNRPKRIRHERSPKQRSKFTGIHRRRNKRF